MLSSSSLNEVLIVNITFHKDNKEYEIC